VQQNEAPRSTVSFLNRRIGTAMRLETSRRRLAVVALSPALFLLATNAAVLIINHTSLLAVWRATWRPQVARQLAPQALVSCLVNSKL